MKPERSTFYFSHLILCLAILGCGLSHPVRAEARCQPITAKRLSALAEDGRQRLVRLDGEAALALLNQVQARVECLSEPPSPQSLAQNWLWLGIARQLGGDQGGARAAFEQALAIEPTMVWDETFADVGRAVFLEVQAQNRNRVPANLELPVLDIYGQFYVDGRPLPANSRQLQIPVGQHLVQVVQASVVIWHQTVAVHAGNNVIDTPRRPSDPNAPAGWVALSLGTGVRLGVQHRLEGQLEVALPITGGWHVVGGLELATYQSEADPAQSSNAWGLEITARHQWSIGRVTPWLGLGGDMWQTTQERLFGITGTGGVRLALGSSWQVALTPSLSWNGPGAPGTLNWRCLFGIGHTLP